MMYLNHEHIKHIEEFGELLMLPSDIAKILELNEREFLSELGDHSSDINKSFYKGILKTEVKIRKKAVGKGISSEEEESEEGFFGGIDIEEVAFSIKDLREFKAKLYIQLHG